MGTSEESRARREQALADLQRIADEGGFDFGMLDERRGPATTRLETAKSTLVDGERLRCFLAHTHPSNAHVVAVDGRWSAFIRGLPFSADADTFDNALTEMIDALREYAQDWRERLRDAPNHRENGGLVLMIALSDDDQLRSWLVGGAR